MDHNLNSRLFATLFTACLSVSGARAGDNDYVQATRFESAALRQDGRVTLTPAFSPDGTTLYFAQSECSLIWECPQRIVRASKTAQGWSAPQALPLPLGGRSEAASVSPDGRTLFFSWAVPRARHAGLDVETDFDLYQLDLHSANAQPVPLDQADINRIRGGSFKRLRYMHNETGPNLTKDGDLYFWGERADGIGERDIFVAAGDGKGGFQTARALPAPINTEGREDGVYVSADGNCLLFSSNTRSDAKNSDLYASAKLDGIWQAPRRLGDDINSRYDDFGARLSPDGTLLLFTSTRPFADTPEGLLQVWAIKIGRKNDPCRPCSHPHP